jgi:hypothetical protein
MQDSQFNIERATNGLVLALFLAAALFLVVMLVRVLDDIEQRRSSSTDSTSAVVRVEQGLLG